MHKYKSISLFGAGRSSQSGNRGQSQSPMLTQQTFLLTETLLLMTVVVDCWGIYIPCSQESHVIRCLRETSVADNTAPVAA